MKSSTIPWICGISLAAMSAAGLSHWWTVGQLVNAVDGSLPVARPAENSLPPAERTVPAPPAAEALASAPSGSHDVGAREEFFQSLLAEMRTLRTENRDLLDQMAETNRDLMKLEFRVDTHSESFRPLPVSETRFNASFGEGPGVLPPRAEPIDFPFDE